MKRAKVGLEEFEAICRAARESADPRRCMIAPHPELRERMKKEFDQLRGTASELLAPRLRLRDASPPGLNDGLIYPGDLFPLGTTAQVVRAAAADRAPLRGTLRVIVVLVDFSDKSMAQNQQHFSDLFFSTGVLPNGSAREYYREVTNNLVDIVGEVVGPFRMPQTLATYAHGASGTGPTLPNARTMAYDAAVAANPTVNFGQYDNDGNGYVDAFIVIHAGPGAEVTGSANDIWSHKWVLPSGAYNADGTNIYAYLTVPEDSKIGVCCHELGHLLFGFPDLYDTDYSSEGIGNWCLMAGGSWNGGGDIPAHASAWCKANQGWANVVNYTGNQTVNVEDVKSSHTVHRLWKDGAPGNEYFLVENRQKTLYDRMLPGAGLLIWHVDEAISGNTDENHPKVALVQADAKRDLELAHNRGDAGDPYPGTASNTTFSPTSTPGSKSYGGVNTCVSVTAIGASGPIMPARFAVKCLVKLKKELVKEKEVKEKDVKEAKDAKDHLKEHKDKDKEVKEKDFKEIKELKDQKEKDLKEFGIDKPTKEVEKPAKEIDKRKDSEKFTEGGGGGGLHGAGAGAPPADTEARLAALETRLGALEPFIEASLRPELRDAALAGEEDVGRAGQQLREGAAASKRSFDTKSSDR